MKISKWPGTCEKNNNSIKNKDANALVIPMYLYTLCIAHVLKQNVYVFESIGANSN